MKEPTIIGKKYCPRCDRNYDTDMFPTPSSSQYFRGHFCRMCARVLREVRKEERRLNIKVWATIKKHAKQYRISAKDFVKEYGWDTKVMIQDIIQASEGICPYCREPFLQTSGPYGDITIDIVNPELLPKYGSNTKWICNSCNATKQGRMPEKWRRYLEYVKEWKDVPESLRLNPTVRFPFYDIIVTLEDGNEVLWSRRKFRGPAEKETDRLNHLKGLEARIRVIPNPPGQDTRIKAKDLSNLKSRL